MIVLAFDDLDTTLGAYFADCAAEIRALLPTTIALTEANNSRLNLVNVDFLLQKNNPNNFLFIAYSHGTSNSLNAQRTYYVSSDHNLEQFQNSFVYTIACSAGEKLGVDLITSGGFLFMGSLVLRR